MTHSRDRHIEQILNQDLKWSPCIGILGMRQTGKTTLMKKFAKNYFSFDDDALPGTLQREGSSILSRGPFPLGFDEVQKFPPFFDQLKMMIDQKKVPGRYLITGSVRFNSKKSIRESMTGRMIQFELFPMTLSESHKRKFKPSLKFLEKFRKDALLQALADARQSSLSELEAYEKTGGLPGICFRRVESIRERLLNQHLDTLFGRDIHMVLNTSMSLDQLRRLFFLISSSQGVPIQYSSLAREAQVSAPTIKKTLNAFEALYLIRKLEDVYFVEDSALARLGKIYDYYSHRSIELALVYRELRCQLGYEPNMGYQLSRFSTRGGAEVPFLLRHSEKDLIAITVDSGNQVSEKSLKSLGVLQKSTKQRILPIALHFGDQAYLATRDVPCIPVHWIF